MKYDFFQFPGTFFEYIPEVRPVNSRDDHWPNFFDIRSKAVSIWQADKEKDPRGFDCHLFPADSRGIPCPLPWPLLGSFSGHLKFKYAKCEGQRDQETEAVP